MPDILLASTEEVMRRLHSPTRIREMPGHHEKKVTGELGGREMKANAAEAAQKHKDDTKSQGIQNYLSQKPQTVMEISPMYL